MHKSRQHESDWISIDRHDSTFNWPARSARTLQISRKCNNLSSWIKYSEFWIIKSSICLAYASNHVVVLNLLSMHLHPSSKSYENRTLEYSPFLPNNPGLKFHHQAPPTERSIIWRTRKGWQQLLADHLPRSPGSRRFKTKNWSG